ncbi:hypothetical protein AB0M02_02195 [Actinoplanes sp. NPDC051861]|uniref:hypothetical protein n=1 Tax=Actinoplanes sp. NPDC051861 TaxID=3155170 RepID=UPI00343BA941
MSTRVRQDLPIWMSTSKGPTLLVPQTITGFQRDERHFTTVVPFRWILDNIVPGLALEEAEREIDEGNPVDPRARQLAPFRRKMQRPFLKPVTERRSIAGRSVPVVTLAPTQKMKNSVGPLRKYLLEQFAPDSAAGFGVLPGFVAVWPEPMATTSVAVNVSGFESPWVQYDFSSIGRGALADGECRHLALERIAADPKVPAALKDKLLRKHVTVEVYHGVSVEQAAGMFVDLNFEGTPVDRITKANIDTRNKWINATKEIFGDLGISLATDGRQLTIAHQQMGQWLLLTHAEQMVKAITNGPYKALSNSKAAESWEGVDFERLRQAGVAWFGEIFSYFGGPQVLADKSRVIRTIAVRVALASLGSAFYHEDAAGIDRARKALAEIDWIVSEAWNGIGGKVVVTDGVAKMAAGSGKETITKAVQAVTKPETIAGKAVRRMT